MPRAGLSVERLTIEAAELADEAGFAAVTVSAIARRVGVKAASIYSHLDGSEELRASVARMALGEIADAADRSLAGRSGSQALAALGDAYRDYAHRHPGRFAAANHPLARTDSNDLVAARHAQLARAALRSYELAEPAETHAVRLLGSTIRGFVDLEGRGGFAHSDPPADESWARALAALHGTFERWPIDD